jgi:hypothetical protein
MPYREIIAVCSEIHAKHINALCGQNTEFLNVKAGGKKTIPLQAWTGPEGSRRLRFSDFKTVGI